MPVIPPEGTYTEAELRFIETQPPGLWPENQDSNFGQLRKVLTDEIQARRDEIGMIAAERFPDTAERYLSLWEEMLGAAINPSGKSEAQRRAVISSRLKYGAFTRPQRDKIIQEFLGTTTGGAPAVFGPSGIPILTGIPLYGSPGAVETLYRVYENSGQFSYTVWIDSANVPDVTSLTRELSRVTPAGISFTIDTTHTGTGLIEWTNTARGMAPSGWWMLDAYSDSSGYGNHGTVTGSPTAVASPGLLLCATSGANGAKTFTGADYVTIPDHAVLNTIPWSIFAIVKPNVLPAGGSYSFIWGNTNAFQNNALGVFGTGPKFLARVAGVNSGEYLDLVGTTTPVVGTTYTVAATFDGVTLKLYVNGVLEASQAITFVPSKPSGAKVIGRFVGGGLNWNGGIDEVLHFGNPLSAADILYLHKQSRNTL